jgi:hypothetical protein
MQIYITEIQNAFDAICIPQNIIKIIHNVVVERG